MNDLDKALKYIQELEERNRILQLELNATRKIPWPNVINVMSLVSHRNMRPRVDIQAGEIHTQIDALSAVDLAMSLLQAAEAACSDAFLTSFLREKLEVNDGQLVAVINEFRDWREAMNDKVRKEIHGK